MVKPRLALVVVSFCLVTFAGAAELRSIDPSLVAKLEAYWKIQPTDEMLEHELKRLAREITPRETLTALYAALNHDPVLIKQYLARPALVLRLSRDLYAFDPALHAASRAEAMELRRQLISGELSPWAERPGRTVFELARPPSGDGAFPPALLEERDGFLLTVILSESARGVVIARYVVPKLAFAAWSETASAELPSQPDPFSFCAVEGQTIVLTAEGDPAPETALLDAQSEPIPTVEYLLSIGVPGPTAAQAIADLGVTTSDAPEPVEAGDLLTYTIVMRNSGPDAALDAEMRALLPEATSYQSITTSTASGSWVCTVPAVSGRGKVSCTSKCFGPESSATFAITVRVDPCVGNTTLAVTTIASSSAFDPNPADGRVTEQTPVIDPGTCDDASVCTAGDQCAPGVSYQEDFDGVAEPFLPPGWTATLVVGPFGARPWRTVANSSHTAPNAVFTPDAGEIRDAVLDSPGIPILSSGAQLRFRNRYILEKDNDGGVLEIKIGDEPFRDILDAGGAFTEGGYNGTISQNFGSPIAGRQAWTDDSGGFVPTTVTLPVSAVGQIVVIRFRMATDRSLGDIGQWIDSVSITGRDVCRPGPRLDCDDASACTTDACDAIVGCGHVAVSCEDGNGCTDDACDPLLQCVHTNNAAPCDDHDACTLTDACAAGACVGSTAVACQDADACTADICDPAVRCVATTANFDTSEFSAGRVDGRDLTVLADSWNSCVGGARYNAAADLNHRGPCIDDEDFHFFMNAFGRNCAP